LINSERKLRERKRLEMKWLGLGSVVGRVRAGVALGGGIGTKGKEEEAEFVQKNRRKTRGAATIAPPFVTTIDNSLPKRMKLDNKRIRSAQCSSRSGHYFFIETGRVEPNRLQNVTFFFNIVRVCN